MSESVVEVVRGESVESRHRISVAVVDADARLRGWSGDPGLVVFARSAVKPIQALPLVEDGVAERFGFTAEELALSCASHSGEPRHVDAARAMLTKVGLPEAALACGAHAPFHEPSALQLRRSGRKPGPLHNNCSGKHAGMLALAVAHDWPVTGYHEARHPVQQRMLGEVSKWCDIGAAKIALGVDGCGAATFALPLERLARAMARFGRSSRRAREGPRRLAGAMAAHPDMVAGTGRLCTQLMRLTDGRVIAKVGAEGVYCAALPGAEVGIALKVEDGAKRAAEPALLAVLAQVGVLDGAEAEELHMYAEPPVLNTRKETVGRLRARIRLRAAHD